MVKSIKKETKTARVVLASTTAQRTQATWPIFALGHVVNKVSL